MSSFITDSERKFNPQWQVLGHCREDSDHPFSIYRSFKFLCAHDHFDKEQPDERQSADFKELRPTSRDSHSRFSCSRDNLRIHAGDLSIREAVDACGGSGVNPDPVIQKSVKTKKKKWKKMLGNAGRQNVSLDDRGNGNSENKNSIASLATIVDSQSDGNTVPTGSMAETANLTNNNCKSTDMNSAWEVFKQAMDLQMSLRNLHATQLESLKKLEAMDKELQGKEALLEQRKIALQENRKLLAVRMELIAHRESILSQQRQPLSNMSQSPAEIDSSGDFQHIPEPSQPPWLPNTETVSLDSTYAPKEMKEDSPEPDSYIPLSPTGDSEPLGYFQAPAMESKARIKPLFGNRQSGGASRKKQKKKGKSMEAILMADAPELCKSLREKGLLDTFNATGGSLLLDGEEDDLAAAAEFQELETVLKKLCHEPNISNSSGASVALSVLKQRYSLEVLVALAKQAESVGRSGWPVSWGWSSRLKSFIFVFDNHNRIVLECPEYGKATYFFEIEEEVPIKWQLRRLIAVMGVPNIGRLAILENKTLTSDVDVSEEDMKVLERFGWTRESGLGSLLNYCDRLFHERMFGMDLDEDGLMRAVEEWKGKIGKRLMDGADLGRTTKSKSAAHLSALSSYVENSKQLGGISQ